MSNFSTEFPEGVSSRYLCVLSGICLCWRHNDCSRSIFSLSFYEQKQTILCLTDSETENRARTYNSNYWYTTVVIEPEASSFDRLQHASSAAHKNSAVLPNFVGRLLYRLIHLSHLLIIILRIPQNHQHHIYLLQPAP
jgi:hypothetical protein